MRKAILGLVVGILSYQPLTAQTLNAQKFSFVRPPNLPLEIAVREVVKENRLWAGTLEDSDTQRPFFQRDTFVTNLSVSKLNLHMDYLFSQENNNRTDFFPFPFMTKEWKGGQFVVASTTTHAVFAVRIWLK